MLHLTDDSFLFEEIVRTPFSNVRGCRIIIEASVNFITNMAMFNNIVNNDYLNIRKAPGLILVVLYLICLKSMINVVFVLRPDSFNIFCRILNYARGSAVCDVASCAAQCSDAQWTRGAANELLQTWLLRMSSVSFSLLYLFLLSVYTPFSLLSNTSWTPDCVVYNSKDFFPNSDFV